MKNIYSFYLFLLSIGLQAQTQRTVLVFGNCDMCKDRIETQALDVIGVLKANWSMDNLILTVEVDSTIFDENDLHSALTKAGHDTNKMRAKDEIYDDLHGCCKYTRPSPEKFTDNSSHILDSNDHSDNVDHIHENSLDTETYQHGSHEHMMNEVSGMIYEMDAEGDLNPIEFASIHWAGTTEGTVSENDGHFVLQRSNASRKLVISFVGYRSDTIDMTNQSIIAITLSSNHILDQVDIAYKKRATQISFIDPVKVHTISAKELCKAACCSLSESFDTSPAIDVSFTDAITGTRKIEMLGLAGPYIQIMRENMPFVRALSAVSGLSFTPGQWIESIQLNQGTGSVVNGPECIAGQINVQIKKPISSEKLYINLFRNRVGRFELNANSTFQVGSKWSSIVLAHGSTMNNSIDDNTDGFYDTPLRDQLLLMNRWSYSGKDGTRFQIGAKYTDVSTEAGQITNTDATWNAKSDNEKVELWTKLGKIWVDNPFKSVGWQSSYIYHDIQSNYGKKIYNASQNSIYSNLIFMNAINGNPIYKYKLGMSLQWDDIVEEFESESHLFQRNEVLIGGFGEFTFVPNDMWAIVVGVRGDHHNNYGFFITPRLHIKYAPKDNLSMRVAGGRGQRTASVIAENLEMFANQRNITGLSTNSNLPYGLNAEIAWNVGCNITHEFKLAGLNVVAGLDYYYTWFEQQVVADWDVSARQLEFYNLNGSSSSHSIQAQLDILITKDIEFKTAYRFNDVKTTYKTGHLQKPLIAKHRAFANIGWTIGKGWSWDGTFNWLGSKRIPTTEDNPIEFQRDTQSPSYSIVNTQITKQIKTFDIYLGVENLFERTQENPIISPENPYSPYFDASLVWGPIFGRNVYVGIRYHLK